MIDINNYPNIEERLKTPFVRDFIIQEGTESRFYRLSGHNENWSIIKYLLQKTILDLNTWIEFKIRPHRGWKITKIKTHFGLKGHSVKCLEQLKMLTLEIEDIIAKH